MKNKGFTLIELLVVVAIIGILAAVGVVAYDGYTKSAKKQACTSNHKTAERYITTEMNFCMLGNNNTAMNGNLNCSNMNNEKIAKAAADSLTSLKNPYDTNKNAVTYDNNLTVRNIKDMGYNRISTNGSGGSGDTVHIDSCCYFDTNQYGRCPNNNVLQTNIYTK